MQNLANTTAEEVKVTLTLEKLKFRNLKALQSLSVKLGLDVEGFNREQLINNLIEFGNRQTLPIVRNLKIDTKFRYTKSKIEYVVLETSDKGIKIKNLKTEQAWWWKAELELGRSVVIL